MSVPSLPHGGLPVPRAVPPTPSPWPCHSKVQVGCGRHSGSGGGCSPGSSGVQRPSESEDNSQDERP